MSVLGEEVIYCCQHQLNMNLMDDDASTLATVDLFSLATPDDGASLTLLAAENDIEQEQVERTPRSSSS